MLSSRLNFIALGFYLCREYEAAAEAAKKAIRANPNYAPPYRWLAAALGQNRADRGSEGDIGEGHKRLRPPPSTFTSVTERLGSGRKTTPKWHDRRVGDAKPINAVNLQTAVHDRNGVTAHLRRARLVAKKCRARTGVGAALRRTSSFGITRRVVWRPRWVDLTPCPLPQRTAAVGATPSRPDTPANVTSLYCGLCPAGDGAAARAPKQTRAVGLADRPEGGIAEVARVDHPRRRASTPGYRFSSRASFRVRRLP